MDKRAVLTKRLAIATAIGMFLVLMMGAGVTATGSGNGCGNDWPLCHGRLIPQDYLQSVIEYSHRFVTSIEGLLVLATSIVAWPLRKQFPDMKVLVPAMAFTLVLQSLMGAAAVKWPTSAGVMATHFGISLICLASAVLIARILIDGGRHRDVRIARNPIPTALRAMIVISFVASILVAYSGAYVRHTHSEIACGIQWPLCNGQVVPDMGNNAGIHFSHRVSAIAITIIILATFALAYKARETRPDLYAHGRLALIVVILQSFAGGLVVLTKVQLLSTLTHAALMAILFVVLADGVLRILPDRSSQASTTTIPDHPVSGQLAASGRGD
ncbi:MAG: COX15/CtaA family protein [Thermomicrobiales bacterium]